MTKIGKVVRIFKLGDKLNVSNYRLMSIVSPLGKIQNKIRVMSFIGQEGIPLIIKLVLGKRFNPR